jgi:hypothetical protein
MTCGGGRVRRRFMPRLRAVGLEHGFARWQNPRGAVRLDRFVDHVQGGRSVFPDLAACVGKVGR